MIKFLIIFELMFLWQRQGLNKNSSKNRTLSSPFSNFILSNFLTTFFDLCHFELCHHSGTKFYSTFFDENFYFHVNYLRKRKKKVFFYEELINEKVWFFFQIFLSLFSGVNMLRGFLIFLVFIWKPSVWKMIVKRFPRFAKMLQFPIKCFDSQWEALPNPIEVPLL